jgi:hypothetical protein
VKIVFNVRFASSLATMSPATRAVTSGAPKIDANTSSTGGNASPLRRIWLPSGASEGSVLCFLTVSTITNASA